MSKLLHLTNLVNELASATTGRQMNNVLLRIDAEIAYQKQLSFNLDARDYAVSRIRIQHPEVYGKLSDAEIVLMFTEEFKKRSEKELNEFWDYERQFKSMTDLNESFPAIDLSKDKFIHKRKIKWIET